MKLMFHLKMENFPKQLIPVSSATRDTCTNTCFNLEFFYNNQPLQVELNPLKHRWVYRNGFVTKNNNSLDHTTSIKGLNKDRYIEVEVPLFAFSKFPANKQITIDVHVWQDYFLSEEKLKKITENGFEREVYYRDTLKTKLIDNTYSFTLTVPAIYKSDIICDSIVLQNDSIWNPYGSDNTLWKSTLPDIYFAIHDLYNNIQGSSAVEKSTAKFTVGDTVPYYHYVEKEPFYINVYDFDMLSKNDLLGWKKEKIDKFSNNKNYCLKFGHVDQFCFRRRYFGKIN